MAKYVYPAVFTPEEKGMYSVAFPDLDGCLTCGDDLRDAMEMAEDALNLMLLHMEEKGKAIPSPSSRETITLNDGEFINLVCADTVEYEKRTGSRAVKKTLSIPAWLNAKAEAAGVNFSQTLQDALKEKLGVA